ncbi:MAG: response regulator [Chloroflexota bacterium]
MADYGERPLRDLQTRYLGDDAVPYHPPQAGTGPLDFAMPWVIELRVVGTPSVLQVQVRESMVVGRWDRERGSMPDIDLEPYRGYQFGVSRRHAVISARNSRVSIRDLNSSNGTTLNGGRLEAGKEYRLQHGDTVGFGQLEMQVFFVVTPSSHEKTQVPFAEVKIPQIGSGQRILIVEDDDKVAAALGSVLNQAGFRYQWKSTVTEAMTAIDAEIPSLVILELMLPDRSGLELVDYIRVHKHRSDLPLIVVSSASGGYQMGRAIEAGVDVFLTKPVGVDELMRSVSKVLIQIN